VVASGWLAAESTFDHPGERRLGPAVISSVVLHAGMFLLILAALSYTPPRAEVPPPPPQEYDVVYLERPTGPGGGGGGSPAPAPPEPVEIPEVTPPDPVPVEPEPEVEPPPPIPVLDTPIRTNAAEMIQASGSSTVSLANYAGGGRGPGIGPGTGSGVGPGEDGGFGGGVKEPGNGVTSPELLKEVPPVYTSEGMRAKVQGLAIVDAIVLKNGTVGEVKIAKSLDRQHGLDQAALDAARKWLFKPCTFQGQPVECRISIELDFRIH
jgi:protein TonB